MQVFYPSPPPFHDVVAVRTSARNLSRLQARMKDCGLALTYRNGWFGQILAVFSNAPLSPQKQFDGSNRIGWLGQVFSLFSNAPPSRGTQIDGFSPDVCGAPAFGHFSEYSWQDSAVRATTDPLGFSQIYYTEADPLLVSNRVELAVRVMEAIGSRARLNALAAAASLTYVTPLAHETLVAGLKIAPMNRAVTLSRAGIRTEPSALQSQVETSYQDLITKAANDIVSNVAAIATRHKDKQGIVSLSGGVDCRILLAALVASGRENEFSYYTYGAVDSDDVRISAGLRQLFGLSQTHRARPLQRPASEVLERGFALNWGMRDIAGDGYFDAEARDDEVILNGGCGENLRGYFSKRLFVLFTPDEVAAMADKDLVDHFISSLLNKNHITQKAYRAVCNRLRKSIRATRAADALTAIDLLYPRFRNRYHFGLGSRVRTSSSLTYSPLYSVNAFEASMQIDAFERSQDRVAFDLIAEMCPEMVGIETTSGQWSKTFAKNVIYRDLPIGKSIRSNDLSHKPVNVGQPAAESVISIIESLPQDKRESTRPWIRLSTIEKAVRSHLRGETSVRKSRLTQWAQCLHAVSRLAS